MNLRSRVNVVFALQWPVIAGLMIAAGTSAAQIVPSFGNFGGPPATRPAPAPRAAQLPGKVNWFPIQAKFAPDGSWVIVNLCSLHSPSYCRLLRWEPEGTPQPLPGVVGHWSMRVGDPQNTWISGVPSYPTHDSQFTTGRWRLIAGQAPDKSYLWPAISWDGKKLAYVVADCESRPAPGRPGTPYDCATSAANPAVSESIESIAAHRVLPVTTVTRPSFRPDDQAIIYWRVLSTSVLASGRTIGANSVYEYDLKSNIEVPKLDLKVTPVVWFQEFTTPFYTRDGKTFSICGWGDDSARLFIEAQRPMCVDVDAQKIGVMQALNDRKRDEVNGLATKSNWLFSYIDSRGLPAQDLLGGGSFTILLTGWRDGKALVNQGNWTYLLDRTTRDFQTPVNAGMKFNWGSLADADMNPRNGAVLGISRTLWQGAQPIPRRVYWNTESLSGSNKPFPVFANIPRNSNTVMPVFWPDVELLQ